MTVLEKWVQVKAMTPQLIACMIIAIDLSNQQAFNADTKAMQQIDFTVNQERPGNTKILFIIKEVRETSH